uniref:Protein SPIRAL1-like 5 n=1 Tax=Picea sitchensis TaxID=3332 RepID=A9NR32_PICSI|nr:unknown [Picea sitchensis]
MGRGVSSGGGKSSLGYLFGSTQPTNTQPTQGNPKNTQPLPNNNSSVIDPLPESSSSPNYHLAAGQNSGNFITKRPSTKVQSVPGGGSSLGYLFGEKK